MKLIDALNGYKNSTRNLLLTNGTLDTTRIELVYKLDQAAATAELLLATHNPFSLEITSDNLDAIHEEADETDDRFRDKHLEIWGKLSLLFNYCY